jgi:Type IV secretion system pilin
MLKNLGKKIAFIIIAVMAGFSPRVFAAGLLPSTESGTGPTSCGSPNGCGNYSLNDILSVAVTVANWILGSVGAIALLFFVYGGFVFILSGGNEERVKQGKQILMNSIIGLAIVFASYLIIQFSIQLLGGKVAPGLLINVPKS